MSSTCGVSRASLWITWGVVTAIGIVYASVSFANFANVVEAFSAATNRNNPRGVTILAASFIGAFGVIVFSALSFVMLFHKRLPHSSGDSNGGFLTWAALSQAVLCLVCGIILASFAGRMDTGLSKGRDVTFSSSGWYSHYSTPTYTPSTHYAPSTGWWTSSPFPNPKEDPRDANWWVRVRYYGYIWSRSDDKTFKATCGLAFIAAVGYFVLLLTMAWESRRSRPQYAMVHQEV